VPLKVIVAVGLVEELLLIVSWPLADPAVVGSNATLSVAVWFGFRVVGKLAPLHEKPDPLTVAEFTVTGSEPVELKVNDCVAVVFSSTSPKAIEVALMLSVAAAGFNCREYDLETPPVVAVNVAVWAELTAETDAANPALAAPAGTVTAEGTVTALSLLARFTLAPPPGAAAFNITVQLSDAVPVSEALLQDKALTTARPLPLRAIVEVLPAYALLERVTAPESVPALVGSNPTESVAACPGFSVRGKVTPEMLKPVPVSDPELMVRGAVPVEDNVTERVEGVLTTTLPKLTLLALRVSAGIHAFSWIAKVFEALSAVAVRVAVWVVVTAAAVAVKFALVEPAPIVTLEGTVTAPSLLVSSTVTSPINGAEFSVTVHGSDAAPVSDALLHDSWLTWGSSPIPPRRTWVLYPDEELFSIEGAIDVPRVAIIDLSAPKRARAKQTNRSRTGSMPWRRLVTG
jgi:hypothetical protein